MKETLIPIGIIKKTFGIKGAVRIKTYSGEGRCLSPNIYIFVEKKAGDYQKLKVVSSKQFKDFFVVQFEGLSTANEAEELVGCSIFIDRSCFPELKEDEYYWIDLLGSKVYGLDNQFLGVLENIIETGGVDVFEIRDGERELLIPFSKKFVKSIDLQERKIIVDAYPFL